MTTIEEDVVLTEDKAKQDMRDNAPPSSFITSLLNDTRTRQLTELSKLFAHISETTSPKFLQELQRAISNGTYEINNQNIALKLMEHAKNECDVETA